MGKTATSPARRGPEGSTSLEAIVDAALSLTDREGLKGLTMRRLADQMGLGAMTLYSYVATKEELLEQLAERILGDIGKASTEADWRRRLSALMVELHRRLQSHPALAAITLSRERQLPALDPFREAILMALHQGGFRGRDAVDAFTALIAYVTGYAAIERARTGSQIETERQRLAALPTERFPNMVAAAADYAGHVSAGAFDVGLESMLDGLITRMRRRAGGVG